MSAPQLAASSSAQASQASQAGVALVIVREVDQAWHLLNPADLQSTLPRFKTAVLALAHRYGLASGALAARFYQQMRRDAGIAGRAPLKVADPATAEQVSRVIDWATKPLWGEPDIPAAQTNVAGAAEKLVLDVGRATILDTVQADPRARGWARITELAPCAFCALLAIRGAVYRTGKTGGFQAHDHCRCHAEPVFTAYEPPARVREWQQLYRDTTTGGNAAKTRREWRRAFDQHTQ